MAHLELVIYCAAIFVALLVGAAIAEVRANRNTEERQFQRARSVTSPKGR